MRRWKKVVAGVLLVVVGVPLLFAGVLYGCEWNYRWRAGQLLAAVRSFKPGVTTQAEYMDAVLPLQGHFFQVTEGNGTSMAALPGAYSVGNRPEWAEKLAGDWISNGLWLGDRAIFAPETSFAVMPHFEGAMLADLRLKEEQGDGHPIGAFVTLTARRYEKPLGAGWADYNAGYSMQQMDWKPGGAVWEYHVSLDERASQAELNQALDFRFRCFTDFTGCGDARKYLQPAPSRELTNQ